VLSHVWGGIEINCKTTTKNLAEYQDMGTRYDQLPGTFQEAVKVTAALGFRYIWIDSLCIVQDDLQDWEREAGKMASIYRGATLTLSATSARNSTEGATLSNNVVEPALQFPSANGTLPAFAVRGQSREDLNPERAMRKGPATSRAWILQEQVLSPRILNITDTQMVWQCATLTESEDGLYYRDHDQYSSGNCYWDLLDTQNPTMRTDEDYRHFERYWKWAARYMIRNLSYPSDQYAAFAGVTRHYQELSGNEPLIGLWREHLPLHLAWTCRKTVRDEKVPATVDNITLLLEYYARRPSWTWMTYPHNAINVQYPGAINLTEPPIVVYSAEILQTNISWSGEPLTSTPSGTITLRSAYDEVQSAPRDPEPPYYGWHYEGRKFEHPDWDPPYNLRETVKAGGEALNLVALSTIRRGDELLETSWLIIEPTGHPDGNQYMRVGVIAEITKIPRTWTAPHKPHGSWREIILV